MHRGKWGEKMIILKDLKTGIWDAKIRIVIGPKHIICTIPYTRWADNTGSLDFKKFEVIGKYAGIIRSYAPEKEYTDEYGDARTGEDMIVRAALDAAYLGGKK
jgi:hypothetical protein